MLSMSIPQMVRKPGVLFPKVLILSEERQTVIVAQVKS